MFRAIPNSPFSWNFGIWDGDSRVAELDFAWFHEQGRLHVADTDFLLLRQGWWSGDFNLEHEGTVLARATKPSAFLRRFDLEYEGRSFVLKAVSSFTRAFGLYEAGSPVGMIEPEHWFTRKATIDLPKELPIPVQLFAFWLVVLMWRRQSKQAAS